jgi:hypothetical protein
MASGRGAAPWRKKLTSSGRQIPTSEQRGHFGLSSERRRNAAAGGDETQPVDGGERLRAQRLVEAHPDALAALAEIKRALVAAIAVVFEDETLNAELDQFGLVGAGRHVRALAALVVDRLYGTVLALDQIEFGDQPEPLGGQRHRARMDAILLADLLRLGQCPGPPIDAAMHPASLHRVGRVRPFALHPFEIREPRAILELVDHPRREIRLIRPQRRGREGELGLLVHRGRRRAGGGRYGTPGMPGRPAGNRCNS